METRNTPQKEIIQKEIDKFNTFFTAEELYQRVKKVNKDIGLATIYRFLKRVRKAGNMYSYTCNNKIIYSKENKSHCHFVCEETGKVVHFDINSLDFLKDKIPGSIISFQIEVRGICNKCSKR
ncbi:MAG: transcriptional repressor [Candidatus Aenigmarchaeota archaeon]|nr:transcriptional repressor [Candidatus Aenigmarchaeota archaeon]